MSSNRIPACFLGGGFLHLEEGCPTCRGFTFRPPGESHIMLTPLCGKCAHRSPDRAQEIRELQDYLRGTKKTV